MRAVTIKEARASLNRLIDAAIKGEQVVLLRRSKHVATIVPITSEDLELPARITDAQAERFWRRLAEEREADSISSFSSPEAAVDQLAKLAAGEVPSSRRGRKSGTSRSSRTR